MSAAAAANTKRSAESVTSAGDVSPTKKLKPDASVSVAVSHSPERRALLAATEQFVKTEMAKNDGSHDWHHIDRVRKLALSLAYEQRSIVASRIASAKGSKASDSKSGEESICPDLSTAVVDDDTILIVELAALLHDIKDWKYSGSETAGADAAVEYLSGQSKSGVCPSLTAAMIDRVQHVISFLGFKSELGYSGLKAGAAGKPALTIELGIVQDADRLDAIGAIGIARCFTYGGSKGRALYNPADPPIAVMTKAAYVAQNKSNTSASLNHFYEKLLLLKDLMKTDAGRARAEGRHHYMQQFIERFHSEWNGDS